MLVYEAVETYIFFNFILSQKISYAIDWFKISYAIDWFKITNKIIYLYLVYLQNMYLNINIYLIQDQ